MKRLNCPRRQDTELSFQTVEEENISLQILNCVVFETRDIIVGIATGLRAGWFRFRIPAMARNVSPLQNVRTTSAAYQPLVRQVSEFFVVLSGQDVVFTIHLHLVPKLR
jgi:hypothetical protein